MLLLPTDRLPDDRERWAYQLKLDGYRAIAFRAGRRVSLRSRNDNDFAPLYPGIVRGLARLPDETVIDGEVVALDDEGRPSFGALQHSAGAGAGVVYYVFDVMVLRGEDLRAEPYAARMARLERSIVPVLREPVRHGGELDASLADLIHSVRLHGFEGLVAKRRDSRYEPARRTGAWQKMRVNRGQPFVIGGYTIGTRTFDALVFGYHEGGRLLYAGRTRSGFTPAARAHLFRMFGELETSACPFANLPEARSGRWGQGLTKAKMAECRWLRPVIVGQFEFVEWTADGHLRHSRFVRLRPDVRARDVKRDV
jgi:bifunctional non-homologous end joining protein LigD